MTHILYIIFFIKHGLADFPLQTDYHMKKFLKEGWVVPLAAHCGVHALFTFPICYIYSRSFLFSLWLVAIEFVIHFSMDRIKASPNLWGRYKSLSGTEYTAAKNTINEIRRSTETIGMLQQFQINQEQKKIDNNKTSWNCLMIDQLVHLLTYTLLIKLMEVYIAT